MKYISIQVLIPIDIENTPRISDIILHSLFVIVNNHKHALFRILGIYF